MEKRNKMIINKKAQVTIFIIFALILVVIIALIFVLSKPVPEVIEKDAKNPQQYIDVCVREGVKQALDIIMPQGGFLEPLNYQLYKNNRVAYLCYTEKYYTACTNQHPAYIKDIENEINNYIQPIVRDCFTSLKQTLEKQNYNIEQGAESIKVNLKTKQVEVIIDKNFIMKKGSDVNEYKQFTSKLNNPAYDLVLIAIEIANQEARFCNFEYVGYAALYPLYRIDKTRIGEDIKIYTITEKSSQEKLNIAIRSCIIPSGF